MKIRRLVQTDLPGLLPMLAKWCVELGHTFDPEKYVVQFREFLTAQCISLVAENDGGLVGMLVGYKKTYPWSGTPVIEEGFFCVDEARRGKGIGLELIEQMKISAKAEGFTVLVAMPNHYGTKALANTWAVFEKAGFQEHGRIYRIEL